MFQGNTFDDFLVRPRYSPVESRSQVSLTTKFLNREFGLPLFSACMDTITETAMANAFYSAGGMGIIHRKQSIQAQVYQVQLAAGTAAAVGVVGNYLERADALVAAGAKMLVVDIAHGHSVGMERALKELRRFPVPIIAGNVATRDGAKFLCDLGVQGIKVGIGNGSICRTRLETGVGIPQAQAIHECKGAVAKYPGVALLADAGIRNDKDVFLSILFGADAVILGSTVSGTDEVPHRALSERRYSGMTADDPVPEGQHNHVEPKGPVKDVLDRIAGHLRSSLSYIGYVSLEAFIQQRYDVNEFAYLISEATRRESFER